MLLRLATLLFATSTCLMIAQDPAPPPLGRLVDVNGHRVHLHCTGSGDPTVVVVGAFSVDWALVQPQVAQVTRICTYDLAGTAWSDPGPNSTCPDRTNEIHTLLKNAGIPGPFVFTGLSVGGLIARFYASQYPNEVAGMVIVDHAFNPRPKAVSNQAAPHANASGDSPPMLIEMTPIILTVEDTSNFNLLPPAMRDLHRWAAARRPAVNNAETADDCESRLDAAPVAYPLESLPLAVISTGNTTRGYKELQSKLVALSRNSKQIMADSFHAVEIDQPDLVAAAIRDIVERIRHVV
jgi:pimeloyl-ACP methyl ester carboxylesterase